MLEKILPPLESVYGRGSMVTALAEHLVDKIDQFELGDPYIYGEVDKQLNDMIMQTIWNWFPGGGTAQIAADKVEEALDAA